MLGVTSTRCLLIFLLKVEFNFPSLTPGQVLVTQFPGKGKKWEAGCHSVESPSLVLLSGRKVRRALRSSSMAAQVRTKLETNQWRTRDTGAMQPGSWAGEKRDLSGKAG